MARGEANNPSEMKEDLFENTGSPEIRFPAFKRETRRKTNDKKYITL
jgi:hypothetical protein